ncbi:hypothetical protein [Streptomyces sp. NPDC088725]|uniref:hypothetical protein n=1 Tax=Streptomyces sp. NPDC088725 TaxID=3365873 RepID=UPI00380E7EE9
MPRTDEPAPIEGLLEGAEVLADTYDDYDTEAARRRVRDRCAEYTASPDVPPRYPSAHEQAAHDLNLAVALIVNAPQAAVSLSRLADQDRMDPEGAVVFGALLHLAGHRDAAQFWWQFAAGGGNRTAACCLFLAHRRRAEFRDAAYWHGQCRGPAGQGQPPPATPAPAPVTSFPLLPETVRHDLISQCRRGRNPSLPASLEAVINRLRVDSADEDFGEVPQPDVALTGELARGPVKPQ